MAKNEQSIAKRLSSLEARLNALENDGPCGSKGELTEEEKKKYASVPVGKAIKTRLSRGLYTCAQLHEIPYFKKKRMPHTLVTSWLEDESGKRLGSVTCSCTSGSCSVSKTCSKGDPFCDCVKCRMTCN